MDLRQRAVLATITAGRRWFKDTRLVRALPLGPVVSGLLRFSHGTQETTTGFRDLELTVPAGSGTIAAGLLGGFYERLELDLFEQLCADSAVVVDVGANLGIYSCLAASRLPPEAMLVCFEPVPGNLRLLRANLHRNAVPGQDGPAPVEVAVEPLAVGAGPGTATLHLADDIGQHRVAVDGDGTLTVPQIELDSHLAALLTERPHLARVDILKIDVEGYDGHVLRGARRILTEDRPALFIEFCVPQLARCGFTAEEFAALLAEAYDEIHIIEETRARVTTCAPSALLDPRYRDRLLNIVAVARPEHLPTVRAWAGRRAVLSH
ncbi:FkbM family methyltransferase [Streptacidiphilus sp. N1-10]|uniref:FkbM family methyltransferase n=1 Tax=Streptacidiphilus jeojiensis TaxID=3229225 RepID=A0ABV6XGP5_9ACTN